MNLSISQYVKRIDQVSCLIPTSNGIDSLSVLGNFDTISISPEDMADMGGKFKGMISSDWNECLAPCGPFDPIAFLYPELQADLSGIFRSYTGNQISLGEATRRLGKLLPRPLSEKDMDTYLEASFVTYRGVVELIRWCITHDILFMINTTGMQGYFQRAMARNLLPQGITVAANPMISYPGHDKDMYAVREIEDKGKNTETVMRRYGLPPNKVILMGDSGGDGPHFAWGASVGAYLVGSMPKASLEKYCRGKGVQIHARFGVTYAEGEKKDPQREMTVDFMELVPKIREVIGLPP